MHRPLHRTTLAVVAALFAAVATPAALAHEFWIMPDAFRINPDALVRVRLFHGERLRGEPVRRNNAYLDRFELINDDQSTPVLGTDQSAVSYLRPALVGPAVIVYQSAEYAHTLPADRFESYLAEEKLTGAIDSRRERAESESPGREVYIRCAKALLSVDKPDEPDASPMQASTRSDTPVGLPFEIVLADATPASQTDTQDSADPARSITAGVLFNGKPAVGIRVVCTSDQDPDTLLEQITDQNGAVTFDAAHPGVWIITALHIERTPERDDADWKSYWASLTFAIDP